MSGLVRSGAGFAVRGFAEVSRPTEAVAPIPDPHAVERDALHAEIEQLRRELSKAKAATESAREAGRREGQAGAAREDVAMLAAVREGIEAAGSAFEARLAVLDGLAPALAGEVLAKLFGSVEDWRVLTEAMLARQLAELRHSRVIAIRVSPADFADSAALDALASQLGSQGSIVATDSALRAGACRIECRLGQIDLDARQQWQEIAAVLAGMAGEDWQ